MLERGSDREVEVIKGVFAVFVCTGLEVVLDMSENGFDFQCTMCHCLS